MKIFFLWKKNDNIVVWFDILYVFLEGGHFSNKAFRILFLKSYCDNEIEVYFSKSSQSFIIYTLASLIFCNSSCSIPEKLDCVPNVF